MTATTLPAEDQRIVHRRPRSTRAAKRRAAIVADLIAELQPTASERHLIETIGDLVLQREALACAQLRGAPCDSVALLKVAALIARTVRELRGPRGAKAQRSAPLSMSERILRDRAAAT